MAEKRPKPGHIDAIGGEVVHKAQRELVVVNGRREVAIEYLEAVVGGHVEGVLNVLDGDVTFGYFVDGVPKFWREDFGWRAQRVLGDHAGRDLAIGVQQAAGLQDAPFGIHKSAGNTWDALAFDIHSLLPSIE